MNMDGVFSPVHIHFPKVQVYSLRGISSPRLKAWDGGWVDTSFKTYKAGKKIPETVLPIYVAARVEGFSGLSASEQVTLVSLCKKPGKRIEMEL